MRILEPVPTKRGVRLRTPGQRNATAMSTSSQTSYILVGLIAVVVFAVVGGGLFLTLGKADDAQSNIQQVQGASVITPTPLPAERKPAADGSFRVFTGDEFRVLYNNFTYPGTKPILEAPVITGNEAADQRLRAIAEARGYRLRDLVDVPMTGVDGQRLQEAPATDWTALKRSAAEDGISLINTSGFRSQDDQRNLFLGRLYATGVTAEQIATGTVDEAVQKVMQITAPPGYSRHHTGYVIDLGCGNNPNAEFVDTVCFDWVSKDNYLHVKEHGWIPSYPQDTIFQGPEPEPWEYVWVGADVLR